MKTKVLVVGILCILSGCAPEVMQSTPSGGLIKAAGVVGRDAKSIKIADTECAKFGKVSKITNIDLLSNTVTYDCVEN